MTTPEQRADEKVSEDSKYAPLADEWPKAGSSASGTDRSYSVQARMAYYEPRTVSGMMLDTRWKTVCFKPGEVGVPIHRWHSWPDHGLYNYQAAEALRWWFVAQARVENNEICLETRLVEHEVDYSWKESSVKAVGYIKSHNGPVQP